MKTKILFLAVLLGSIGGPCFSQWQPSAGLPVHNHQNANDGGVLSNQNIQGFLENQGMPVATTAAVAIATTGLVTNNLLAQTTTNFDITVSSINATFDGSDSGHSPPDLSLCVSTISITLPISANLRVVLNGGIYYGSGNPFIAILYDSNSLKSAGFGFNTYQWARQSLSAGGPVDINIVLPMAAAGTHTLSYCIDSVTSADTLDCKGGELSSPYSPWCFFSASTIF